MEPLPSDPYPACLTDSPVENIHYYLTPWSSPCSSLETVNWKSQTQTLYWHSAPLTVHTCKHHITECMQWVTCPLLFHYFHNVFGEALSWTRCYKLEYVLTLTRSDALHTLAPTATCVGKSALDSWPLRLPSHFGHSIGHFGTVPQ